MSEMDEIVQEALNQKLVSYHSVAGGDINEAYLVQTESSRYFMKMNTRKNLNMFVQEQKGIEAIASTHAIGCPHILQCGAGKHRSYLLMDVIDSEKRIPFYWQTFAAQLHAMHSYDVGDMYGFGSNNYIGSTPQINTFCSSWIAFFRDYRLRPMIKRNKENLSSSDLESLESIISNLDKLLVEPEHPSLVHGDLWSGNVLTGNDGKAWLIDPACYYGDAEVDLAMTELFGGFPKEFYDAYPIKDGYTQRKEVYNLYHLLNHLYLFGYGYYGALMHSVEKIKRSW